MATNEKTGVEGKLTLRGHRQESSGSFADEYESATLVPHDKAIVKLVVVSGGGDFHPNKSHSHDEKCFVIEARELERLIKEHGKRIS